MLSTSLIRGSAQCVSISIPCSFFFFPALIQIPWIPRGTIFPRLMLHPDVQCLLDLQFGETLLHSPEALMVCIAGLHTSRLWKRYRDKSYIHTRIWSKGNVRCFRGQGEVISCSCAWGKVALCFLPSQHLACLHSRSITLTLLTPTWSSFSSDRNTKTPQRKVLTCRFLGQI